MATLHERHVHIVGFGGQGIIMAGEILGRAAALYDHKYVSMMQSYGPEVWGCPCSVKLIIGDEEVLFPYVKAPQVLVCLSQEGYVHNVGCLCQDGMLIWDADLVQAQVSDPTWTTYHIPATRFAAELGDTSLTNMVMLGFLPLVCDLVSVHAMREAVLASVPEPMQGRCALAFERGYGYGEAPRMNG